ncbi:hypothetical protein CHU_3367 [Cytophaga hutchinsonii ATCC 33406]|uniref:Uncharacterized protein n=1 Tax=Cytophaga hutchinsonii (strain ATCC 33406 / DSM 1761 / CIP 103989 / NBRC 15051 / NCIMB 9469 / D465) TaxID=269798 RepID=A0A6N4SVQ4_CYTH3|nr:hypothetical protein CHU_3367 [Cytophaga hutchinsonii ATCC 33406]SFX89153.1 hypothetical protein SAMN04487930_11225 [Cytophaga hutchinsonii ATCC 33406]
MANGIDSTYIRRGSARLSASRKLNKEEISIALKLPTTCNCFNTGTIVFSNQLWTKSFFILNFLQEQY